VAFGCSRYEPLKEFGRLLFMLQEFPSEGARSPVVCIDPSPEWLSVPPPRLVSTHRSRRGLPLLETNSLCLGSRSPHVDFCFQHIPSEGGAWIPQWYSAGLRAGWSGVWVPVGAGNFSPHHRVQTGSGAHPSSYPTGTRGSFPGGKADGSWSWPLNLRLVPRSIIRGVIPPLPNTP
jgi:hypothetical protein